MAEKASELAELQKADPGGYEHLARIYPGLPHWMNRKDAEAVPWLAKHTRNPWPQKVVLMQSGVTHTRFYWLAVPTMEAKPKRKIVAEVEGQGIHLTGDVPSGMILRLSDLLLDLDQPVRVLVGDHEAFNGKVLRQAEAIRESLQQRADPRSAATATVVLK